MTRHIVLGIIPARGGSKGVPRKNIRPLCGRPLIEYTLEAALNAKSLDRVIISTDDQEIADVARSLGGEVPFLRPYECATDTASSISVIHHALAWLQTHEGYRPDAVALLSPTCPLRTPGHIDGTANLLRTSDVDSSATICEVADHPFYIYSQDGDNKLLELLQTPNKPQRRQDLPVYYGLSQSVLVSRIDYFEMCKGINSASVINLRSVVGFEIDRISGLDIDTLEDLQLAEFLISERCQQSGPVLVGGGLK